MPVNEGATGTLDGIGQLDHSVTSEYRIFGSPGTGKTTEISRLVARAVEKYGPDSVLVTSFSRTAAAELASRDLKSDGEGVGTLHSHCFHALGRPTIAEANVREWNIVNPHLALTPVSKQRRLEGDEVLGDERNPPLHGGDVLLQELNRHRGLMLARKVWPAEVRDFEQKWSRYKRESGLLDFTDLIEICCRDMEAPNRPRAIFADEAQDLNVMQLNLIRKWGAQADYSVVAGDDDQTVYPFCGATPEALLNPDIPEDHKIVLAQSYRVPRAIHRVANALIHQVTRRQKKIYRPREGDGAVVRLASGSYKSPEYLILSTAVEHLARGKTLMFLASCSYMLQPIIAVLRKNAIPFHNPYRKSCGFWNPLRIGSRGSAANRILSLVLAHPEYGEESRPWTNRDLTVWTEWLYAQGILRSGARKLIEASVAKRVVTPELLAQIFEPGALASLLVAMDGDSRTLLAWWRARLITDVHDRVQFPAEVAAMYGPRALMNEPRVVVGTVHSVKGGQADVVYLFPDLSRAGDARYQQFGPSRDSVIRVFYVGATRARETLYIGQPEGARAVLL